MNMKKLCEMQQVLDDKDNKGTSFRRKKFRR